MLTAQSGVEITYYDFEPMSNTFFVTMLTIAVLAAVVGIAYLFAPKVLSERGGFAFIGGASGFVFCVSAALGAIILFVSGVQKDSPDTGDVIAAIEEHYDLTLPRESNFLFEESVNIDLGKRGSDETIEEPMYNVPGPDGGSYEEGKYVVKDGRITFYVVNSEGDTVELGKDTAPLSVSTDKENAPDSVTENEED